MKTFVTGSTGLLGNNVVRTLLAEGHEVKALVRSPEKAMKVLPIHKHLHLVTGDMEDVAGFARELAGCDAVFHTAAYFREYFGNGDHWTMLERININGTMALLHAAEEQGVRKVIYVGSANVIGRKPDGSAGDETTPPDKEVERTNLYMRSKVMVEARIAEFLQTHPLDVVLILPSGIFGPGDAAPTASGRLLIDFLEGKLPAVPPGGFSVVDARDVAQAMISAVAHGKRGERYIISDRYYSIAEILQIVHRITGKPLPRLRLSYPLAMMVAGMSELQARLTGTEPQISFNAVRVLMNGQDTLGAKAMRELGTSYRPFDDTLRDMVNWFIENGYTNALSKPVGLSA